MQELIFVMGITHSGKSTYIKNNFDKNEYVILDLLDYQKKLWNDYEHPTYEKTMQSYINLLEDIKKNIEEGKEKIVIEHTLLKARRRAMYLDELKKYNVKFKIICMMVKKKNYNYWGYDQMMEVLEEPTRKEGWDEINTIWR